MAKKHYNETTTKKEIPHYTLFTSDSQKKEFILWFTNDNYT